MDHRIVAVVEARMGSSRLPGKSLRPLVGVPLAVRVAERVRRAKRVDAVVVATSTSPADDPLAATLQAAGLSVFRGSEHDVLGRILGAVRSERGTVHVQCWGDCAFVEPSEIDRAVDALEATGADLVGNSLEKPRTLPYGLDVIAFKVAALEVAERETRDDPYHREHGTTFLYQNPDRFQIAHLATPPDLAEGSLDLTINTEADYAFVSSVYERLLREKPVFDARDVLALLRAEPSLLRRAAEEASPRVAGA